MKKLAITFIICSVFSSCQTSQELVSDIGTGFNRVIKGQAKLIAESVGKDVDYLIKNFGGPVSIAQFEEIEVYYYSSNAFKVNKKSQSVVDYAPLSDMFYRLDIEGLSEKINHDKIVSAVIVSGMKIETQSLEFKAYTQAIQLLLTQSKRYKTLEKNEQYPDELIVVEYFISEPKKETKVWSVPNYVYVPNTTFSTTYYGSGGYTGTSYTTANNGGLYYAGNSLRTSESTTYDRTLSITAFDGKEYGRTKKSKEIWKIRINSAGPVDGLRQFVTDASIASFSYWGRNLASNPKIRGYYKNPAFDFLINGN